MINFDNEAVFFKSRSFQSTLFPRGEVFTTIHDAVMWGIVTPVFITTYRMEK